jgi:hypothetical protein
MLFLAASENALIQAVGGPEKQGVAITITRLHPPVFPAMANAGRVGGDIELKLGVRQNGSVASAAVVSGRGRPVNAPFSNSELKEFVQAALESARKSRFQCRGCTLPVTSYSLVYSFEPGPLLRDHCPSMDVSNTLFERRAEPRIDQSWSRTGIGPGLKRTPGQVTASCGLRSGYRFV